MVVLDIDIQMRRLLMYTYIELTHRMFISNQLTAGLQCPHCLKFKFKQKQLIADRPLSPRRNLRCNTDHEPFSGLDFNLKYPTLFLLQRLMAFTVGESSHKSLK